MARYIDVEPLIENLKLMAKYQIGERQQGILGVIESIKLHPTADVVEVKHGKWYQHNKKEHGDTCWYCSVCEKMALSDCMVWELTDYCPNCGAKMDGERK